MLGKTCCVEMKQGRDGAVVVKMKEDGVGVVICGDGQCKEVQA